MEDIFYSDAVNQLFAQSMAEAVHHTEFESVSVDATLKCCLSILGQSSYRAGPQERASAALTGKDCFRKVPGLFVSLLLDKSQRCQV